MIISIQGCKAISEKGFREGKARRTKGFGEGKAIRRTELREGKAIIRGGFGKVTHEAYCIKVRKSY